MFNWSKDYVSAASEFDEARKWLMTQSTCIKRHKLILTASRHCSNSSSATIRTESKNERECSAWAVARNHEAMMEIYIDKKVPISDEEFLQMTQTTFSMFRLASSTEKGLKIMKNCSKYDYGNKRYLMNNGRTEEAVKLLRSCYEESLEDEKCYSQG